MKIRKENLKIMLEDNRILDLKLKLQKYISYIVTNKGSIQKTKTVEVYFFQIH